MEQDADQNKLVCTAIYHLINKIDEVVSSVRKCLLREEDRKVFVDQHMNKLVIIPAYVNLFTVLGVGTRKEAESLLRDVAQRDHDVDDAVMTMLEKEQEYDLFLKEVEEVLYPTTTTETTMTTTTKSVFHEGDGNVVDQPMSKNEVDSPTNSTSSITQLPPDAFVKTTSNEAVDIRTFLPPQDTAILVFIRHFG